MEFIQRKTIDRAIENYLAKAANIGIDLAWDRYEGQLPECGFCETGLSCRDCLQGPCISHPFREMNKTGVCGKDKDDLAAQSFLRLVLKGAITYLDQVSEFSRDLSSGSLTPNDQAQANNATGELDRLVRDGNTNIMKEYPASLGEVWRALGIKPEGVARDIFKSFQKLEGGLAGSEEIILRGIKAALLACEAARIQGRMKRAVFGHTLPTSLRVNLGVLEKGVANIILMGNFSPVLKKKILLAAQGRKVKISGICTDLLLPPQIISPVTNYSSQELPFLTGVVDLAVAGDQGVNPSLTKIVKACSVPVVYTEGLGREADLGGFAQSIVDRAEKSFALRQGEAREVPEDIETAIMGFSEAQVPAGQIVAAMKEGRIKGLAIISGCGNVKFTQDRTPIILTEELLKRDVLCLSVGEASVSLAKYGFLNPAEREKRCGAGLNNFLTSLGKDVPAVIDFGRGENGGIIDLLIALAGVENKPLKDYPLVACFPEGNRSAEVVEALWYVAHGVTTYFWPALPVTGSPETMAVMSQFLADKLGASLPVQTDKKLEPMAKAGQILKFLRVEGAVIETKGGYVWKKN